MKIYVSSTFNDLKPYRAAVMEAIRSLNHDYVAMEYYPAGGVPAAKVQEDVARCDAYIGIVAWRYGFIPESYDCSITELEYRAAVQKKIPTLIFLLDEDAPWVLKFVDGGEPGKREIDKFRNKLQKENITKSFNSEADLHNKATQAIVQLIDRIRELERIDNLPPQPPPPPVSLQIQLARLPSTGAARFGREQELKKIDEAWDKKKLNILSIFAWGGVGKSALINTWLARLANDNYRGARKAFGWPPFACSGCAQFWVTPIADDLPASQVAQAVRQHHLGRILIASVHEAYPGHHVQFSHALKVRRPFRHIFASTVFVEGWGLYCEELMLKEGFKREDPDFGLLRMSQIRDQLWRALRIVIDVGLHCKGMSQREATDLLVNKHILDEASTAAEVMYYCSAPTQPMSYMVGKLLLDALIVKCQASGDERFESLSKIHNALLAPGALPFPLLERALGVT